MAGFASLSVPNAPLCRKKVFILQMLVSNKVFENKGAVLRPFSARDAETEGIRVGMALGMKGHALSTQRALLHKEFLLLMRQSLQGLTFRLCRASDAFDLFLSLSGEKPASEIFYRGPKDQFLSPTRIRIGKYAPIYAKVCESLEGDKELILSRDLSLIEKLEHALKVRARTGTISQEELRSQGLAFGYPRSAVERYVSASAGTAQMNQYARLLLENDITIAQALWNAPYIPTISGGKVLEMDHLEFWNSALARELPPFAYVVGSAHNKLLKIEFLTARSKGKTAWNEGERDRVMREAIENAYGVPLPVGY